MALGMVLVCLLAGIPAVWAQQQPTQPWQAAEDGPQAEALRAMLATLPGVPPTDSAYVYQLTQKARIYLELDSFRQCLNVLAAIAPDSTRPTLALDQYLLQIAAYHGLAQHDEAETRIVAAAQLYPMQWRVYDAAARTHWEQGHNHYAQALPELETALHLNPLNSLLLYKMGLLYLSDHQYAPATCYLLLSLLIEPGNSRNLRTMKLIEEISTAGDAMGNMMPVMPYLYKLEARIRQQEALAPTYPIQGELGAYTTCRQADLMLDALGSTLGNGDFFSQYYLPFIRHLAEPKLRRYLPLQLMRGVDAEKVQQQIEAYRSTATALADELRTYVSGEAGVRTLQYEGQTYYVALRYPDGTPRKLYAQAALTEQGYQFWGDYRSFHPTGKLHARAHALQGGSFDGPYELLYEANGRVKERGHFANGLRQGSLHTYHPNGQPQWVMYMQEGKITGPVRQYSPDGKLLAARPAAAAAPYEPDDQP
jgi:hypothetical protein